MPSGIDGGVGSNSYIYDKNGAGYKVIDANKSGVLGKDDFLKILVTQLKYQNPLNPMQDQEFINQMTQFSVLEKVTEISEKLSALLDSKQPESLSNPTQNENE